MAPLVAAAPTARLEGCACHRPVHRCLSSPSSQSSAFASTSFPLPKLVSSSALLSRGIDALSNCSWSNCHHHLRGAIRPRLPGALVFCSLRRSVNRPAGNLGKALRKCATPFANSFSHYQTAVRRSRRTGPLPVLSDSGLAESSPEVGDGQVEKIEDDVDVELITEWELDFCSRPILDSRGKRIWELLVCDRDRHLLFARFYPNNVINSGTLRDALLYIIDNLGVPKPQKIRFFRSQMQTIIGKACAELEIQSVPSRRCFQLLQWLEERFQTVYSQHPGYREGAGLLTLLDQSIPVEVPDNLRGEQWAFVQIPLSALQDEIEAVERGDNFGSVFSLESFPLDLPPDAMIPGVAVASKRALPLAAWTNALELASLDVEVARSRLVLSSGVANRWTYASWRRGEQGDQEAEAWERAKSKVGGLHFLALQQSLDSEQCAGFWLLLNPPKSSV